MTRRLLRASAIVTVLSLAGLGASFLLQMLLAALFGASAETDAYLAATTIPTLVTAIFLTATNITFIPVFTEYEHKAGRDVAWRIANSVIILVVIGLALLSLPVFLFSAQLIHLIAPGLSVETNALAAELQRILLPSSLLLVWGGLLGGLFYAQQSFGLPTLGPLVSNLVAVVAAWLFVDSAGIYGVAIGVLVGSAAQLLFLFISLSAKYEIPRQIDLRHPGVRQIGRLILPWLLGAMVYKANPVVDRLIASQFPAGAISILGYAALLAQVAVFACSKGASLALFPTLSRLANSGQLHRPPIESREKRPEVIDLGLRIVISFLVPILVVILLQGETLVAVVFQRGAFSTEDAYQTSLALIAYAGSVVALSLGNVVTYVYYALQDTKTPAIIAVAGMGLNLALALLLQRWFGFYAPAISYSLMALFNFTLLILILRRRLGGLLARGFWAFCGKTVAAGAAMAIVIFLIRPNEMALPPILQLLVVGVASIAVYLVGWAIGNRSLVARLFQRAQVST
jgi:putative peptidoglycan lipid II flippase